MKVLVALFLIALISIDAQSFCDKYSAALSATGYAVVETVVNATILDAVATGSPIRKYFDGSKGVNFTAGGQPLADLRDKLVKFFGAPFALNCTDGSVGAFTGNIKTAHTGLGLMQADHHVFNSAVINNMLIVGVDPVDAAGVALVLNSLKTDVCTDAGSDCYTFCNNYTVPALMNGSDIMSAVVLDVVTIALGSPLLEFFNGTRGGRPDYTNPANVADFNLLFKHLVEFFGTVLGCTDGSLAKWVGDNNSLKSAHVGMNITKGEFDLFNSVVISVMRSYNVTEPDLAAIHGVLNTTETIIVDNGSAYVPPSSSAAASSSAAGSSGGASSAAGSSGGASSAAGSSGGAGSSAAGSSGGAGSSGAGSSGAASSSATPTPVTPATTTSGMILIAPLLSLLALLF